MADALQKFAAVEWEAGQSGQVLKALQAALRIDLKNVLKDQEIVQFSQSIRAQLDHYGMLLVQGRTPITAFDFFQEANSSLLSTHPELHEVYLQQADTMWSERLPECTTPELFERHNMKRVIAMYTLLGRADRLYDLCGTTLNIKEMDLLEYHRKNPAEPVNGGWSPYLLDVYRKAITCRNFGDNHALTEDQYNGVGQTFERYGEYNSALSAYYKCGNFERIASLCVRAFQESKYDHGIAAAKLLPPVHSSQGAIQKELLAGMARIQHDLARQRNKRKNKLERRAILEKQYHAMNEVYESMSKGNGQHDSSAYIDQQKNRARDLLKEEPDAQAE